MARLIAYFQCYENYGDDDSPRWKAKGADEVLVRAFAEEEVSIPEDKLQAMINEAIELVTARNSDGYYREPLNWVLLKEGEYTEFEKDQLEWDGKILYPPDDLARFRE